MDVASTEECVEALARYRELRGHSPGTARLDAWVLRTLGLPPQRATLLDLERLVLRSQNRATRASYCSRIRSSFSALRELGLIDTRVDEQLPRLKRPEHLPKPLTDDQVRTLLSRLQGDHLDVLRVSLLTGARAMELCAMRGEDLSDGTHGPELLLRGKGGRDERVPAHPVVVEIIQSYRTLGRLWPRWTKPASVSSAMGVAMSKALGEPANLHQARHVFGTRVMVSSGYDLLLTSQLMRHKSLQTTKGYVRIADTRPRAVIELLAG